MIEKSLLTRLENIEKIKFEKYNTNTNKTLQQKYQTLLKENIKLWSDYQIDEEVKEYIILQNTNYNMNNFMTIYNSPEKLSERKEGSIYIK